MAEPPDRDRPAARSRWCNILHVVNDGYLESLTLLLPFIALDLELSYSESGLLRTAIEGAMAATQIPAGFLAERLGELLLLGAGTAWYSASYLSMSAAVGFATLFLLLVSAGAGAGVYHPVGTAAVANAYPGADSGTAIGRLNFFGDVGKVLFPALAGLLVASIGWRGTFTALGGLGMAVSVGFLVYFRTHIRERRQRGRTKDDSGGWGIIHRSKFTRYAAIGFLDVAARTAVVTFLGFQLLAIGMDEGHLGWMLSLTFAGGAIGKLLCGMLVVRLGEKAVILLTELGTVAGCILLPLQEANWQLVLFLPVFGFVLNGTSSVIYIGLASTLSASRRSRGYALYFTTNFFCSAAAPFLFGLIADLYDLALLFKVAAITAALGLPLLLLRDSSRPRD